MNNKINFLNNMKECVDKRNKENVKSFKNLEKAILQDDLSHILTNFIPFVVKNESKSQEIICEHIVNSCVEDLFKLYIKDRFNLNKHGTVKISFDRQVDSIKITLKDMRLEIILKPKEREIRARSILFNIYKPELINYSQDIHYQVCIEEFLKNKTLKNFERIIKTMGYDSLNPVIFVMTYLFGLIKIKSSYLKLRKQLDEQEEQKKDLEKDRNINKELDSRCYEVWRIMKSRRGIRDLIQDGWSIVEDFKHIK